MDTEHIEDTKKAVSTTTEETATAPTKEATSNNKNNIENSQDQERQCKIFMGYLYGILKLYFEKKLEAREAVELITERLKIMGISV